jgi:hypothetical protein
MPSPVGIKYGYDKLKPEPITLYGRLMGAMLPLKVYDFVALMCAFLWSSV